MFWSNHLLECKAQFLMDYTCSSPRLFWGKSCSFKWGHFVVLFATLFKNPKSYITTEGCGFLVLQIIPQNLVAWWKKLQKIYIMERRECNWSHNFTVEQGGNFLSFFWQSFKGRRTILIALVVIFRPTCWITKIILNEVNKSLVYSIQWWFDFSLGSVDHG